MRPPECPSPAPRALPPAARDASAPVSSPGSVQPGPRGAGSAFASAPLRPVCPAPVALPCAAASLAVWVLTARGAWLGHSGFRMFGFANLNVFGFPNSGLRIVSAVYVTPL